MPQLGYSITEGKVLKWHKKEGDTVKRDETIFEITTDKIDSEIPSPASGTLTKILVPEGETVKVGVVVAHLEAEGASEAPRSAVTNLSAATASASPAPPYSFRVERGWCRSPRILSRGVERCEGKGIGP